MEKNRVLNRSLNHPAYLMHRELKLALRNSFWDTMLTRNDTERHEGLCGQRSLYGLLLILYISNWKHLLYVQSGSKIIAGAQCLRLRVVMVIGRMTLVILLFRHCAVWTAVDRHRVVGVGTRIAATQLVDHVAKRHATDDSLQSKTEPHCRDLGQELIRRWDTRTWLCLSVYLLMLINRRQNHWTCTVTFQSTRPVSTFPAKEITPLAATRLYCLVTFSIRKRNYLNNIVF